MRLIGCLFRKEVTAIDRVTGYVLSILLTNFKRIEELRHDTGCSP